MQKSEAAKLLGLLKANYPAYYRTQEGADFAMSVDLWTYQFQENSFQQVFQALNAAIASKTDGFPPSIGEVKMRLVDLTDPAVDTFDATWDRLLKCFSRGSIHAQDDWERLPEDDRELISPGEIYRISTTEDCNLTVEKAGYYSRWKAQQERKRVSKSVPLPIREALKQARENALETQRQAPRMIETTTIATDILNEMVAAGECSTASVNDYLARKRAEMEAEMEVKQGGLEENQTE